MLSGLTACSSTEDSAEDSPKPKPEVPVNDGDWQTVPTSGGTITKDSLSITFPSGTFSSEAKVAITEVERGKIGGEYEASKFYQIAMPCTASKPLTFKMKNSEKSNDIIFVAQADAYSMSTGEVNKKELHYDTKYSDGEYFATIPAIMGDDKDENVYFTIGLGRFIGLGASEGRTRGYTFKAMAEGKVQNVSYELRYHWNLIDWALYLKNGDEDRDKALKASIKLEKYIQESLKKIFDLGFKVEGDKTLYVDFNPKEKDFGSHHIIGIPGEGGWNMYVDLGRKMFLEAEVTEDQKKCTLIHEILHWVQSFYDPRSNYRQASGGTEETIMAEMGAVWIEQFMNNGQLNGTWLNENVLFDIVLEDKLGLTETENRLGTNYKDQGYSMAPLLYYLCSTNEMKDFGFKNESVVEIYELWGKYFSSTLKTSYQSLPTVKILEQWAVHSHDCYFFSGDQIDKYYLKLLSGNLVKDVELFEFLKLYKVEKYHVLVLKNLSEKDKLKSDNRFEGENYPYGCSVRAVQFSGLKDESLKDKSLVIKQVQEGMQTYLLTANKEDRKYVKLGTVAKDRDSIVVSGSELESYRKADGTFDQYFFVITTRTTNSTSDTGKKPWKVAVELQEKKEDTKPAKVEPDKVTFEAEGGTNSEVKITKGSYKHCDVDDIATPYNTWLSAKCSADGIVTIEAQPNTATEGREGKVYCWVSNKENPSETDKKYLGPVIVIQEASDGSTLLDRKDLEFPVEGGAKFIGYSFGDYQWMKRRVADDTWLKSAWSVDYLDKIPYYPSNDNRFSNQLYVCCLPNETGEDRKQTITFAYSMEKGFDFDTGVPFPVEIRQKGGSFDLDMMKNLFVGTWYTAKDFDYNKKEGQFYHRRYTFREDHTLTYEGQYTFSDAKPSSWIEEFSGTYSVLSYEVRDRCVVVKIKIPSKDTWYKGYLECWPHWLFFGYENTDGSISHGFYMERE